MTLVSIWPRTFINSLENVLRSLSRVVVIQRADDVISRILLSRVFVKILHALPESIIEFATVLPYWIFAVLFCCSTRNSCHIVIRITIMIRVVDLITELLITSYVVNRFLIILLSSGFVNLFNIRWLRLRRLRFWFFVFVTFLSDMTHYSAVITFLTFCRADLTMIMAQKLATIDKNTGVLVVLENSWVAGEIFSLLFVVRGLIASLLIANSFYWLSICIKILICLLLILCTHLHMDCNFKCFRLRHCLFEEFFSCIVV